MIRGLLIFLFSISAIAQDGFPQTHVVGIGVPLFNTTISIVPRFLNREKCNYLLRSVVITRGSGSQVNWPYMELLVNGKLAAFFYKPFSTALPMWQETAEALLPRTIDAYIGCPTKDSIQLRVTGGLQLDSASLTLEETTMVAPITRPVTPIEPVEPPKSLIQHPPQHFHNNVSNVLVEGNYQGRFDVCGVRVSFPETTDSKIVAEYVNNPISGLYCSYVAKFELIKQGHNWESAEPRTYCEGLQCYNGVKARLMIVPLIGSNKVFRFGRRIEFIPESMKENFKLSKNIEVGKIVYYDVTLNYVDTNPDIKPSLFAGRADNLPSEENGNRNFDSYPTDINGLGFFHLKGRDPMCRTAGRWAAMSALADCRSAGFKNCAYDEVFAPYFVGARCDTVAFIRGKND